MKKNIHPLITGALLLTIAGLASRLIGFFYKIFLASLIGAEGIGIYQMVFPLYILCVSLSASGIQTAISRFTAENLSTGTPFRARKLFRTGLLLSLFLSVTMSVLLTLLAKPIALFLLREERCLPLLRLMAAALPFEAIHGCVTGYLLGQKNTVLPACFQLIEQIIRVTATVLLYQILRQTHASPTPELAAGGLLISEFAVSLLSLSVLAFRRAPSSHASDPAITASNAALTIAKVALPITGNRLLLNLLQSVEAAMIPLRLQRYYSSPSMALSSYGIFTGMALPLVMFPSAITGAFSMILLPTVSEAHALKNERKIAETIRSSLLLCLYLGTVCTALFLRFGSSLGRLLYQKEQVGSYLITLAWICPFFYLTTITASILHGLGKTMDVFFHNLAGIILRLLFTWFLVPFFGIRGCLWGLLASQLLTALLGLNTLRHTAAFSIPAVDGILCPAAISLIAVGLLRLLQAALPVLSQTEQLLPFLLSIGIWGCIIALFSLPHLKAFRH